MAAKSKTPAAKRKRAPARRKTPRKAAPSTRGTSALDCQVAALPQGASAAAQAIEHAGGAVLCSYLEPLGRTPLLLAALPIDTVEPTPFQRDLSDAHHKRLSEVIDRTGSFLDPIIAITAPEQGFWTPNGLHRLQAMRRLGAKAIVALVVPNREIAWQILALNTEKAHNLRERALEVIRIYQGLIAEDGSRPEQQFTFYLEEPSLVTLGLCYQRKGNFAGGAYHSILRRLQEFVDVPIKKAISAHERVAEQLLELDATVAKVIDQLKEKGLVSPYLRTFVVARINPLRWIKDEPPPLDEVLTTMQQRASRFNVEKVKQQDLARMGGAPDAE